MKQLLGRFCLGESVENTTHLLFLVSPRTGCGVIAAVDSCGPTNSVERRTAHPQPVYQFSAACSAAVLVIETVWVVSVLDSTVIV